MQYYCEGVFGAANGHCRLAVTTMLFLVPGDGRMTDDGGKLNPATTTRVPEISVCVPRDGSAVLSLRVPQASSWSHSNLLYCTSSYELSGWQHFFVFKGCRMMVWFVRSLLAGFLMQS